MNKWMAMVTLTTLLAVTGCATVQGAYNAHIKGPWYMGQARYQEGIAEFRKELAADPRTPEAAYWLGRYHLALDQPEEALPYLTQAVRQDPENAETHFWLGVDYWALGDWEREREQYEQALVLDSDHLAARLYLAHNRLDQGQWDEALAQYDKVLELDETQAEALYDRAQALDYLGRAAEARQAWKRFLDLHPEGAMALTATDNLNARGGFEYRNVYVGQRRVTIKAVEFGSDGDLTPGSLPTLDLLGAMLANRQDLVLHVVVYVEGDKALARARALAVRRGILDADQGVKASQLPLSWFGVAEKISAGNTAWRIRQSVNFVTQVR